MWSVATEWQIYFLFPALLLPIWRRFGNLAVILIAFFVGLLPHILLSAPNNFDWASPWFLGLFAMGMSGAVIAFADTPRRVAIKQKVAWNALSVVFVAILLAIIYFGPAIPMWQVDLIVGAASTCLIVFCTRSTAHETGVPLVLRLLESRGAVALGTFSYSIYLVHLPIQQVLTRLLQARHFAPAQTFAINLVAGIPFILALAYLFHMAFEQRFMSFHPRSVEKIIPLSA